jgi:membrane fusion protein (multidrug efflux system)
VGVEEGDHVAAGATLIELDDDRAQIEDLESQVNLRHLETGFERIDEMYQRQLVSSQTYEDKQFELEQAKLRRARARLALEHTVVRAPFSGVITSRSVQLGSRVGQSTKLFDLVKHDDLIAHVFVPGKYLAAVEVGQAAEVESHYQEGVIFDGHVKRISPVIDPRSGTFRVTVGVGDNWKDLRPGIFVNVRIITATHPQAVLVPKQAVVYDGGERYVFVVADSVATRVRMDAGFENSRYIEARSLIQPQESIIVVGQSGLRDQARVRIMNVEADSGSTEATSNQVSGAAGASDDAGRG